MRKIEDCTGSSSLKGGSSLRDTLTTEELIALLGENYKEKLPGDKVSSQVQGIIDGSL